MILKRGLRSLPSLPGSGDFGDSSVRGSMAEPPIAAGCGLRGHGYGHRLGPQTGGRARPACTSSRTATRRPGLGPAMSVVSGMATATSVVPARVVRPVAALGRRDALFQFDDPEAALALLLRGLGDLRQVVIARFHGGTSHRCKQWSAGSWVRSPPRPADRTPGDAGPRRR